MKIRGVVALIGLASLLVLGAACGNGDSGTPGDATPPQAGAVVPAPAAPAPAAPTQSGLPAPAAPAAPETGQPAPAPAAPATPAANESPFSELAGVSLVPAAAPADEDVPLPVARASPGPDAPPVVDTPPERDEARSFEEAVAPPLIPASDASTAREPMPDAPLRAADPPAAGDAPPDAAHDLLDKTS